MAGYTRQDTANNIANGNVIDADDFDAEYNAIEAAFSSTSGHTHDGTEDGGGAPITVVGPAQDIVVSGTKVEAKTHNAYDLGSDSVRFKNAYVEGVLDTNGTLDVTGNATLGGTLNVTGDTGIDGNFDINTNKFTVNATSGNTVVGGTLLTGATTIAGTLNAIGDTTVGGTLDAGVINGTTVTATTFNGSLSGNADTATNLATPITLSLTGDVAGTVADIDGSGDISIATTIQPNSVTLGADTTGNYVGSLVAGTGVTLTNNTGEGATPTVAIGQAVGTTDDVTFNDVVVSGDLTVSGTTTTVNTETINLADNVITLNSNETGTPTQDGGIEVERGTSPNKTLIWNESTDKWSVGSDTFVAGSFEGDLNSSGYNVMGSLYTAEDVTVTGDLSVGGTVYGSVEGQVSDISNHSITDLSDANQTVRTTDSPTFAGVTTTGTADVSSLTIGNFELVDNGAGELYIKYFNTTILVLNGLGRITVADDVVAYGSI
jgi:hypothetical protein